MRTAILGAHSQPHRSAMVNLWQSASTRCRAANISPCIQATFPDGVQYFNVGHSNLRQEVLAAVRANPASSITVFIHDVIPVSYPEYSRPEVTKRFSEDLQRVSEMSDIVIYNSRGSRSETETLFSGFGRVPASVVAHLGTDDLPNGQLYENATENPEFVTLGTIEPRKNHAMLLEIWQGFVRNMKPGEIPKLHIIGRRGWNNASVFNMLDTDPTLRNHVFEHNDLADEAVDRLLAHSWGLLFPSFVEGFGLPLIEAARHGVPILCGENDVYREILGDYPLYLNVDNSYAWSQGILERAGRQRESEVERQVRGRSVKLPDWKGHFDRIFRFV